MLKSSFLAKWSRIGGPTVCTRIAEMGGGNFVKGVVAARGGSRGMDSKP